MQDRIAEYSAGDKTIATRIDWLGSFRRLLPMYWKYKQAAEYWKSWQDPDKIKSLEAENANLLAIAQEQRAEIARLKRAIIAANRGVIAGEGVGLAYYMENCYGVEDSPAESVEVIHQVTGE